MADCVTPTDILLGYFAFITQRQRLHSWFQGTVICGILLGLAFSIYENGRRMREEIGMVLYYLTLNTLSDVLSALVGIGGIYTISRASKLGQSILQSTLLNMNDTNSARIAFVISHMQSQIAFVLHVHIFLNVELRRFKESMFELMSHCLFQLFLITVLFLAHKLKNELDRTNQLLFGKGNHYYCWKETQKILQRDTSNESTAARLFLESLKCLTEQFRSLYEKIDMFNEHFQFFFALAILSIMGCFLKYWVVIIIELTLKDPGIYHGFDILFWSKILYSCYFLNSCSQAALTALVGENLELEGQKTTKICYSLLNKLSARSHSHSEQDQLIKEQLHLLLDESKSRKVYLHAGGFFKLNWGILGSIASTVATYSIVITQFTLK